MIVIVDYGMGNLLSVANMLRKVGVRAAITSDPQEIARADKIVLPGVGAFDNAMQNIRDLGLLPVLNQKGLEERVPVLGICLGMQLLMRGSEEGDEQGLGWIPGEVCRFRFPAGHREKIPHMGWNVARATGPSCLFPGGEEEEARFYFVHSFHVVCDDPADVLAYAHHGYDFPAAVQREHIRGVQFHPEKSHKFGMRLLRQFVEEA
jgi:imidazole glycerol-phosphate synthase subunit HisH